MAANWRTVVLLLCWGGVLAFLLCGCGGTQAPDVPGLKIAGTALREGDAGRAAMMFSVRLSTVSFRPVIVAFATADGTATAGADYTAVRGTVTFAPGETVQHILVSVLDDILDEGDETFTVTLVDPANARLVIGTAVGIIVDDDERPRVLLIGDSISLGYNDLARAALADVADVVHIGHNCDSSSVGLVRVPGWLPAGPWQVIHFNFGLHDIELDANGSTAVSLAQYEQNLREIIRLLRERYPDAGLFWAGTTPVPAGNRLRRNEDVLQYNAAAARLMAGEGIPIDDLYAGVAADLPRYQKPGDVHFLPAGYAQLASAVSAAVRVALGPHSTP